jgi:hypothetical protein
MGTTWLCIAFGVMDLYWDRYGQCIVQQSPKSCSSHYLGHRVPYKLPYMEECSAFRT